MGWITEGTFQDMNTFLRTEEAARELLQHRLPIHWNWKLVNQMCVWACVSLSSSWNGEERGKQGKERGRTCNRLLPTHTRIGSIINSFPLHSGGSLYERDKQRGGRRKQQSVIIIKVIRWSLAAFVYFECVPLFLSLMYQIKYSNVMAHLVPGPPPRGWWKWDKMRGEWEEEVLVAGGPLKMITSSLPCSFFTPEYPSQIIPAAEWWWEWRESGSGKERQRILVLAHPLPLYLTLILLTFQSCLTHLFLFPSNSLPLILPVFMLFGGDSLCSIDGLLF